MKWMPKDVIALVIIVIAGVLLGMGINNQVGWTLIAVVCAYYGIDLTPWLKVGRNQKKRKEDK